MGSEKNENVCKSISFQCFYWERTMYRYWILIALKIVVRACNAFRIVEFLLFYIRVWTLCHSGHADWIRSLLGSD